MKNFKNLLSLVLALVILVGCFPQNARAASEADRKGKLHISVSVPEGGPLEGWSFDVIPGHYHEDETPCYSVLTDDNGEAVLDLEPGDYTLREIPKAGWYCTVFNPRNITIKAGETVAEEFCNEQGPTVTIATRIPDGNIRTGGTVEDITDLLAGWTFDIYDGRDIYEGAEPLVTFTTTTGDVTLDYKLNELVAEISFVWEPGIYTIRERKRIGWTCSGGSGYAGDEGDYGDCRTVWLSAGYDERAVFINEKGPIDFDDVAPEAWYRPAVDYVFSQGIMAGVDETRFDPSGYVTRGQLVTILYRMAGSPDVEGIENPFADVPQGKFYTKAVIWASGNGVVNGISATEFAPDKSITREQIVTMLYRFAKFQGNDPGEIDLALLDSFADGDTVSSYAKEAVAWAVASSILSGSENSGAVYLDGNSKATRAQIAALVMRYCTT